MIKLSRKELYERVWAEPMQKLTKEYSLSDVGLAKICRRFVIPVPPRGYWARKHAGKPVSQTPLPSEGRKGYGDNIFLPGPEDRPVRVVPPPTPLHPLIEAESDPANAITVPEDLKIRHPLLKSTREYWRFVKGPDFRWDAPAPAHVGMDINPATRPRALRVLQALFTALERRGHQIVTGERNLVQLKVLDETCDLSLRERQRRVRREPPKKKGPSSLFDRPEPFDLVHTGELEMRIDKRFARQIVRDGKGRALETQLNDVIVHLLNAALREKEYRAEQERARLAEIERERQRAIAKQRAREKRARIQRFERLVSAASHYKQLVAFAAELRQAVGHVEPESELGRWLEWVDGYVDSADVLGRFRNRQPRLTLYYCASIYEADRIVKNGFENRLEPGGDQELPASVVLTDVPMEYINGGSVCVVLGVPEDAALPYESTQDGKGYRRFSMPASLVNQFPRTILRQEAADPRA